MMLRRLAVVSSLVVALSTSVAAQEPRGEDSPRESQGGTYLKLGLGHWQGNIFSSQSLTRWDLSLFSSRSNLTSAMLEVETYFARPHLLLSGFSIGYRKDALRRRESGHLVHAGVFRAMHVASFELRASGGAEWGVPSLNFDSTEFDYRDDGAVRYSHTYPIKNANVPLFGTAKDGALYPYLEFSVVQRPWVFLLEGGIRMNIVGFQFDDYEVDATDAITYGFESERIVMPYLFVNLGLRLF
jgi:hypothetical protein